MARRNNRPSEHPLSRFQSETPQPSDSDQENRDPGARARAKGKERAMGPPPARTSIPTPTSDASDASRGQKRKRVDMPPTQLTEEEEDMRKFTKWYDPDQPLEERREVVAKSRALVRKFEENRPELLRNNDDSLAEIVEESTVLYKKIKQTGDAAHDARLLVNASALGNKKAANLSLGDTSTGVDVDEFLAKCITFMRNGGPSNSQEHAPSSSRRPRNRDRDDDDDELADQPLDWEVLGRHACFPYNARPPVPTFLLGPLSVEKKVRTQTQRKARQAKDTTGRETRPQALNKDDLAQSDEHGLTTICTRIRTHLATHIAKGAQLLQRAGFTEEDSGTERCNAMLKKCRLAKNGGVSLFEYVVNPRSFGQTVENIFYISFLIKEGAVGVSHDDDGLPTLDISEARTLLEQRKQKITKHQAVLAIDYATWRQLIDAFDIRDSMIPHREDEQPVQVGERGWYA